MSVWGDPETKAAWRAEQLATSWFGTLIWQYFDSVFKKRIYHLAHRPYLILCVKEEHWYLGRVFRSLEGCLPCV